MSSSIGSMWRWSSLVLLVALMPLELGGLAATQAVLDIAPCDGHDELDATQVECPCPAGIDLLEIEDDEGVAEGRPIQAHTITTSVLRSFDSPHLVHIEEFERPPRA